jgi:hypothetical protein
MGLGSCPMKSHGTGIFPWEFPMGLCRSDYQGVFPWESCGKPPGLGISHVINDMGNPMLDGTEFGGNGNGTGHGILWDPMRLWDKKRPLERNCSAVNFVLRASVTKLLNHCHNERLTRLYDVRPSAGMCYGEQRTVSASLATVFM